MEERTIVMNIQDLFLKRFGMTYEEALIYDFGSTEEDMSEPPEIDPPEKPEVPNTPTEKEASQTTI